MRIAELESRTPECLDRLLEVWERSVRATRAFLCAGEVEAIKTYVPQALREVPHLVAGEDERGVLAGFYERMGFRVCRRTETDEQGGPYPLLYMRL